MIKTDTIINQEKDTRTLKILFVFNRLSDFEDQLYKSFLQAIDGKAFVDVYVQPFSPQSALHFDQVIRHKTEQYDVIALLLHAVHLNEDILKTINSIPKQKLLLLDKKNPFVRGQYACVYHDFQQGIAEVLASYRHLFLKYQAINIVIEEPSFLQREMAETIRAFTQANAQHCHIYTSFNAAIVRKNEAYLVFSETFLAEILKVCQHKTFTLGKDLGIVSYHETPLKEVLCGGITVLTANHTQLGKSAAELILQQSQQHVPNPFVFIQRNSL